MKDSLHTLIFSAALGLVCALLLTGAAELTKTRRKANAKAEKIRNILGVLGVPFESGASSQELEAVYRQNVRPRKRGDLEMFEYVSGGKGEVRAVAVPFAGSGLWGPIEGYLSMKPDLKTILGVTFHKQQETPGLGGEIASDGFRKKFKGKAIEDDSGKPGIIVRRGGAAGPNEVDAITGATMTCDKVEKMLSAVAERIVRERDSHGG